MALNREGEFRQVFDRLYPQARRVARRITRDEAIAEEIAAEALTRLFARWLWLSRRPHMDGWTIRVATNLALDSLRRSKPVGGHPHGRSVDAMEHVVDRILLSQALGQLPRRQREVVTLRYLGDLAESEVASVLGVSAGSVKTHLHRGLAALRRTMAASASESWEVPSVD